MSLGIHFAIGYPPSIVDGHPEGGRVDAISGFGKLPSKLDPMDQAFRSLELPTGLQIETAADSLRFRPPIPVFTAHRVGDVVLEQFGATIAA